MKLHDPAGVLSVLLTDGWHDVVPATLQVREDGSWSWTDKISARQVRQIQCPATSVVAVRYVELPPQDDTDDD